MARHLVSFSDAVSEVRRGGVAVIPTDTLYGIVAKAASPKAVARVYRLRRRNPRKPCIILIRSRKDLARFGITLTRRGKEILRKIWPGAVSVILPCPSPKFRYLHRGTKTLAFRLPKPAWLRTVLSKTGPLIAPSANREGMPPAKTVAEAYGYFGDRVSSYVDKGRRAGRPSTLIALYGASVEVLRKGAGAIPRSVT